MRALSLFAVMILTAMAIGAADQPGFVSIFDGKTLKGWTTDDFSYWTVQDGAITGRITKENPATVSKWLVWQGGDLRDFELHLKYRIEGGDAHDPANSGIQFHCLFNSAGSDGKFQARTGYQADISLDPPWMAEIYSWSRGVLAERGQSMVIDEIGGHTSRRIGNPGKLLKRIDMNGWNEYDVVAQGHHFRAIINGRLMSEVFDYQHNRFVPSGWLGLQLEHGPPMEVQFKDILLKN